MDEKRTAHSLLSEILFALDRIERAAGEYESPWDFREPCEASHFQPAKSDTVIYFLQSPSTGRIKIGITSNLKSRMSALRSAVGEELHRLLVLQGERGDEREIHRRFACHRLHGEWFAPHDALTQFIQEHQETASAI